MRYLALDWGTVRVGVAVSDPDGKIAFPLDHFLDAKTAVEEINKLVSDLQVDQVLIGLPKALSGKSTEATAQAQQFLNQLKAKIGPPIETLDERYSSVAAGKTLADQGITERQQRGLKDNLAAQMMLQQYLDSRK